MKFQVVAGDGGMAVVFEPSGAEYRIGPGDHLTVQWPDTGGPLIGAFEHSADGLTISEPSGPAARIWNSAGEELSILG